MKARSVSGIEAFVNSATDSLHPGWLPVLGRVPLFQALSQRHLRRVGRLAEMKRFKKDTAVVRAGARGDAMYVILDGGALVETPAGHTRKLTEGDYFGELALLDGAPRAATVTATGVLTTARIGRTAFLKLVKEEPSIGIGLARGLLAMVRDMQKE
jgi:CPA1 family monovalent cation:H+ antiporter